MRSATVHLRLVLCLARAFSTKLGMLLGVGATIGLELKEFALIEERGDRGVLVSPPRDVVSSETYGCGCYWLQKPLA